PHANLCYGTFRDGPTLSLSSQLPHSTHRNAHNAWALQTDEDQAERPVDNSRTGRDNRQRDDSRWESPESAHRPVERHSKPDARLSLFPGPTHDHRTLSHISYPQVLLSKGPCRISRELRVHAAAPQQTRKARELVSVARRHRRCWLLLCGDC